MDDLGMFLPFKR